MNNNGYSSDNEFDNFFNIDSSTIGFGKTFFPCDLIPDNLLEYPFNSNTNDNTNEINNLMNPENRLQNNQIHLELQLNENNFQEEQRTIQLNEDNEENVIQENKKPKFTCKKKNSKYGRKTNEDKIKGKKGVHTKEKEDNIMRKIKSFFLKRMHRYLLKITKEDLLKLELKVNKSLKKEFNLNLLKKTLKDIYIETKISKKYKHKKVKTNEKLINRIYSDQKQNEAIKILNLTYEEAFEIFRRKLKTKEELSPELKKKIAGTNILNPKYFEDANVLIENEKENCITQENMKYMDNMRRLILEFKNWFENKIGRNRKKY